MNERWHNVVDVPPPLNKEVLCCGYNGGRFIGYITKQQFRGDRMLFKVPYGGAARYAVYWAPLLHPPTIRMERKK